MRAAVLHSLLIAIVACTSSAEPAAPTAPGLPPSPPAPLASTTQESFGLRTEVGRPPGGVTAVVVGLDPGETFTLWIGLPGRPGTPEPSSADESGRFETRVDQLPPSGLCLVAKRSGGQTAQAAVGIPAGGSCAADEASFAIRTEIRPTGGATAIVQGLDPGEAFTLVIGRPGEPGVPMPESADGRGDFEISFPQLVPGGYCLLAKRSGGEIARSEFEIPAGGACAADIVYLYLSGPATLRASEFTDFTSVAPAGEVVEFIGLVGPDGPRVPDWTSARVGPPPEGILFRLSPDYERQGPLPVGRYVISYRLMGQRYDFTLTITR